MVLLRGINLGPRNRVSMPELRAMLAAEGFAGVRTYLQSGNVVVRSDLPPQQLAAGCRAAIRRHLGLDLAVVARTAEELEQVVRRDPLGEVATDPKRYQVTFLSAELDAEVLQALHAEVGPGERLADHGRELYAWHPHGVARSRLWARLAGTGLGVTATSRNWTTVTRLLAMIEEPPHA